MRSKQVSGQDAKDHDQSPYHDAEKKIPDGGPSFHTVLQPSLSFKRDSNVLMAVSTAHTTGSDLPMEF